MTAFSISFLVQWPLIIAGCIKGLLELRNSIIMQTVLTVEFLGAMLVAMIIAYGMISAMGILIQKRSVWKISYYMMVLAVVTFLDLL